MFFQKILVSMAKNDNIPDTYAKNKTTTPKRSIEVLKKYKLVVGKTKYNPIECKMFSLDINNV